MKTRRHGFVLGMLALVIGCGGGSGSGDGDPNGQNGNGYGPPPPPSNDHPACIISADCPSGEFCDLGECIQECNTIDPCTGEKTCSPRGRCVEHDAKDQDPAPTSSFKGDIKATQTDYLLTDRDTSLEVPIETTSSDIVRYRVELNAPHLRLLSPVRGSFSGKTKLKFDVVTDGLTGRDLTGTIRVITTLGDVIVHAPIHVGLTGSYKGALRYDGGSILLGDAQLAVDILETKGEAKVRVDSKASLLFPSTSAGETTGRGSFTLSDGLDVTVVQVIPKTLGGVRNRFARDIGRMVRFKLKPAQNGDLEGTFEETLTNLFTTPVTMKGSVHLQYLPRGKDPEFTVSDPPSLPSPLAGASFVTPGSVFGWSDGSTCEALVCGSKGCSSSNATSSLNNVESTYTQPLNNNVALRSPDGKASSTAYASISTDCVNVLSAPSFGDAISRAASGRCGVPQAAACGLPVAARFGAADASYGKRYGKLLQEALAPALLVAKDEVVQALRDSFAPDGGLTAEGAHYDKALKTLGPTATWVLQPASLEFLRNMTPSAAVGPEPPTGDTTSTNASYPAARALADLFQTLSVIDGERARIAAGASAGEQPAKAQDAQERAIVAYLEAATLTRILDDWGTVPPSVGVKLTSVLSPIDQGFVALAQGANVFGVPAGFVPFVYRAEDVGKGPTNFEQMLAIASASVASERDIETTFLGNARTCDSNYATLQNELKNIRTSFDLRLKDICGEGFDPDAIGKPADWQKCGATGTGEVGVLMNDIALANARVKSAQDRVENIKKKIAIDTKRLADTQGLHQENIRFIDDTGAQIEGVLFTEVTIDAMIEAAKVASNASLVNFGAPLGEAAMVGALGVMKGGLEVQKKHLENAMTLKAAEISAQVDYVNGMAEIQKQMIDAAQAGVDAQQDLIAAVGANLKLRNQLVSAKNLLDERQKDRDLVATDPSNDPSFRLLRDAQSFSVLKARSDAQKQLYLAASALQYEINVKVPEIDGAVLNAHNGASLSALASCLNGIYTNYRTAFGTQQDYATTLSVRKVLGIDGPRVDSVTGQTLTEGELFRRALLQNQNLDGQGGVGIVITTNLQQGNGLWSTDVCSDKVATVQAQLVGDFLGDNQAQVNLSLAGGSFLRACDSDQIVPWSLGPTASSATAFAVVQAGVNTYGEAAPNTSLFGQSVARASWKIVIPGGAVAPSNSDLDVTKIEDIVLKVSHKALPRKGSPVSLNLSCLSTTGS